jgi:hypothetical protein
MDKITTLTLVDDDRFLRATQEELPDIEYRTADGIVMKPKLKDGEIVGFTATGPDGGPLPVISAEVDGRCYFCVCTGSGNSTTCTCTEVRCPAQ